MAGSLGSQKGMVMGAPILAPSNPQSQPAALAMPKTHGLAGTSSAQPSTLNPQPLIRFRPFQLPVFQDRSSGILILHWSRQIGKSFTFAAWAVDRLLTQLQRYPTWLITVLSNSRDNGG